MLEKTCTCRIHHARGPAASDRVFRHATSPPGARCLVEAPSGCGDGALDLAAGEQCDDGNTTPGDGCSPTCQLEAVGAFCGDATVDAIEICDDGNTTNGDGCNATCNLTGTTSVFVGMPGMAGSIDGAGTAARIRGNGTLAADERYLWFAESGGSPGATAALRRTGTQGGAPA